MCRLSQCLAIACSATLKAVHSLRSLMHAASRIIRQPASCWSEKSKIQEREQALCVHVFGADSAGTESRKGNTSEAESEHTTTTQFKIMSLSIHTHPALSVLVAALALAAAGVVAYRYSCRAPRTSRRNGDFTAPERWKNGPWAVSEQDMKASPRVSELWIYPIKV
jgi:hypothetical protein